MGASVSAALRSLSGKTSKRLLLSGLDAAGKTTILYKLKLGEIVTTIPTIGFNVEQVSYKNVEFTAWDVGGRDKIRPLWRHYTVGMQGLIFVVDSNDRDRIDQARDELASMLELMDDATAVLVFANKQDLPNAMKPNEIWERLELGAIRRRDVFIQACSAPTGDGLYEGLEWLSGALRRSPPSSSPASAAPKDGAQEAAKGWLQRVVNWVL